MEVEKKIEIKCTEYAYNDDPDAKVTPCKCPVCGAFLKFEGENYDQPKCNKCGTDLLMIPDRDEETGKELDWGKICPISGPSKNTDKQSVKQ